MVLGDASLEILGASAMGLWADGGGGGIWALLLSFVVGVMQWYLPTIHYYSMPQNGRLILTFLMITYQWPLYWCPLGEWNDVDTILEADDGETDWLWKWEGYHATAFLFICRSSHWEMPFCKCSTSWLTCSLLTIWCSEPFMVPRASWLFSLLRCPSWYLLVVASHPSFCYVMFCSKFDSRLCSHSVSSFYVDILSPQWPSWPHLILTDSTFWLSLIHLSHWPHWYMFICWHYVMSYLVFSPAHSPFSSRGWLGHSDDDSVLILLEHSAVWVCILPTTIGTTTHSTIPF